MPSNILRNHPVCSLTLFWIVSLTPFNNKPESSRDLAILMTSSFNQLILLVLYYYAKQGLKDDQILRYLWTRFIQVASRVAEGLKT